MIIIAVTLTAIVWSSLRVTIVIVTIWVITIIIWWWTVIRWIWRSTIIWRATIIITWIIRWIIVCCSFVIWVVIISCFIFIFVTASFVFVAIITSFVFTIFVVIFVSSLFCFVISLVTIFLSLFKYIPIKIASAARISNKAISGSKIPARPRFFYHCELESIITIFMFMISMIVLMISVMAMIIFMIIILWSYVCFAAATQLRQPHQLHLHQLLLFTFITFFGSSLEWLSLASRWSSWRSLSCFLFFDQIDYRYLNHIIFMFVVFWVMMFIFLRLSFAALAPAAPATPAPPAIAASLPCRDFCFVDLCDFDYLDAHRYLLHDYDGDDHHHSNYHYHSLYHFYLMLHDDYFYVKHHY